MCSKIYDFITNFTKLMFNNCCMWLKYFKEQDRRGRPFLKTLEANGWAKSVLKYLYSQTKVIMKFKWSLGNSSFTNLLSSSFQSHFGVEQSPSIRGTK